MNPIRKRPPAEKQVNVVPPLPGETPRVVVEYGDGRVTMRYRENEPDGGCTEPRKPRISWL
jgi:hypothetical protein